MVVEVVVATAEAAAQDITRQRLAVEVIRRPISNNSNTANWSSRSSNSSIPGIIFFIFNLFSLFFPFYLPTFRPVIQRMRAKYDYDAHLSPYVPFFYVNFALFYAWMQLLHAAHYQPI
jgi:hypothetical protein